MNSIIKELLQTYPQAMHLKVYINDDNNLKKLYLAASDKHNKSLTKTFLNAGFDLYVPGMQYEDQIDEGIKCFGPIQKVDFKIQCSAIMYTDNNKSYNTGYYMYPRSSLSKTDLRLANSVGIIDSGYRGNIMGMFDVTNHLDDGYIKCNYFIQNYDRLVQICAPNLAPIYVEIVDTMEQLGEQTERGAGGFGSTGR